MFGFLQLLVQQPVTLLSPQLNLCYQPMARFAALLTRKKLEQLHRVHSEETAASAKTTNNKKKEVRHDALTEVNDYRDESIVIQSSADDLACCVARNEIASGNSLVDPRSIKAGHRSDVAHKHFSFTASPLQDLRLGASNPWREPRPNN